MNAENKSNGGGNRSGGANRSLKESEQDNHQDSDHTVNLDSWAVLSRQEDLPLNTWQQLKLLQNLGTGSFGEVYLAWDENLHRQVALKLLKVDLSDQEQIADQVLQEGRMLAKAEHPHVARIYGVDSDQGRLGFWMEYIDGVDLHRLVSEQGAMSAKEAAVLGVDLCAALAAVHGAGVVHGDIKAQNVMKETGGRVVLMDFGAGTARNMTTTDLGTRLSGTPAYMAPEIFRGEESTPRSDIYSLGVLLFFLVTGRHPVPGDTLGEIVENHRVGQRQRLRDVRPDLPAKFIRIVEKAMEPDRARRFSSAGEMEVALANTLGYSGDKPPPVAARLEKPAKKSAEKPRLWASAALLAATLAIVLGVSYMALKQFNFKSISPDELAGTAIFRGVQNGVSHTFGTGDVITSKDLLGIDLELTQDAFVYILNMDDSGQMTVIYPMVGDSRWHYLESGSEHYLPGTSLGERLGWTLSQDRGVERFLIVASTQRLTDFEKELENLPTVEIGGGLSVKPMPQVAVAQLTRGVTGVAQLGTPTATEASSPDFLFDLVRQLQENEASGEIWMHEMRLLNPGQAD